MKMFDYLSTGRAIIASNIPVFHEILNEKTSIFCDPFDSQEWISAIKMLSKQIELRSSMQKAALDTASKFSWKNRAKTSISMLEDLL